MDSVFFIDIIVFAVLFFAVGALFSVIFFKSSQKRYKKIHPIRHLLLGKHAKNPILQPGTYPWTAEAVMNPAALVLDDKTHLVYRAIGNDGVSRLGYASSDDGITFDKQLSYPIYTAWKPRNHTSHIPIYSPTLYPSGGSFGGCEDPRMVLLGGQIYVTFNMFDGWDFIRVAVISIDRHDFLAERFWKWSKPHILSRPNETQKNWVLFPEKIGNKFAVLHSIAPEIEISYHNDIESVGVTEPFIKSWVGSRSDLSCRKNVWDSRVRSTGPPPVKTEQGWLLFYHANDEREPNRYKLGVMLLDNDDPTKVLHRSSVPILSPDAPYENHGKPGIVYACGAVVRDNILFIYYGGADKVVCVATVPLDMFVRALVQEKELLFINKNTQIIQ